VQTVAILCGREKRLSPDPNQELRLAEASANDHPQEFHPGTLLTRVGSRSVEHHGQPARVEHG
jgi:hypothetical protein